MPPRLIGWLQPTTEPYILMVDRESLGHPERIINFLATLFRLFLGKTVNNERCIHALSERCKGGDRARSAGCFPPMSMPCLRDGWCQLAAAYEAFVPLPH